jgi:hypothetical protein
MFDIIIMLGCGEYRFKAKTTLSITSRINEVINKNREDFCTHEILNIIVTRCFGRYNNDILYYGCCAFGN